jgi:hypothetical protein
MFKLYDLVKLKNADEEVGVKKNDVGIIVDIVKKVNGDAAYSIEFVDLNGATNITALMKYYLAVELELVNSLDN